ncbi:MAG: hypothetical protein ACYC91_20100 [Solirubrobacteraceae bacterium]
MLIDAAGTAHIVWNENRGDAADVVVYCRIKRGASGCDSRTELAWDKSYGVGDGPQFNSGGPPKIVQVGGQLVVFSHRYPTVGVKPDGASSSTVISWTSGDGGTNWSPVPAVVGKWNLGQVQVIGPGDDPTILNIGVDPLCGAPGPASLCLEAYKSGQYTPDAGNLSTVRDENYYENLVLDEHGRPVVAAEDLANNAYVRRWTEAGSPTDPATWTTGPPIPMDQIALTGGPAGVYMMGKPKTGYGPYSVSRLLEGAGGAYSTGPSASITPAQNAVLGKLAEDPSGRLTAAWEQRATGLQVRTTTAAGAAAASAAKPTFGSLRTVAPGGANGQLALGAAADGGGFVVYNHTGGINGEGQIAVVGIGTQTPTGKPGIDGVKGGGLTAGGAGSNGSCQQLGFGSFVVESRAGCLFKGTGAHSDEYVTSSELNLWGLRIVPDAGVKIIIDPRKLQLDTTGGVRVIVTAPAPIGDVVLFHGTIHRDLSQVLPGTNLFEFPSGLFKANVLGFGVSADIKVRLEKDGVHIPVDLALPKAFGGFTGHAELIADRTTGLHVNSVHIHLGPIPLGAMIINKIDLDYAGAGDIWTGAGSLTVPAGGTLSLNAQFAMGEFKSASFTFKPGTPIPIGPFVYLLRFGGGFGLDPVTIDANATIGAGAAVQGESPVKVDGDFRMTFPAQGPADFRLKGSVALFLIQIGDGSLDFQSDGYAAFRGHESLDLGPLRVNGNLAGFIDATTGQYGANIDGRVALCVTSPVKLCAAASAGAAISNKGFAACAHFDPPDPIGGFEAGLTYPWADFNPDLLVNPTALALSLIDHIGLCHTAEYTVPPPRPLAARSAQTGTAVVVPAGLPTETILVQGVNGAPQVEVTGPDGEEITSTQASKAGFVLNVAGVNASYVVLRTPKESRLN